MGRTRSDMPSPPHTHMLYYTTVFCFVPIPFLFQTEPCWPQVHLYIAEHDLELLVLLLRKLAAVPSLCNAGGGIQGFCTLVK